MSISIKSGSGMRKLIAEQEKAQRGRLWAASACAMIVSAAAVILLGLSAWFLTASAIAGLAGPLVAKAFNYMIPSSMIRLLAILRTAGRYGERVIGHDAALQALAKLRPQLFDNITRADPKLSLGLSSGETSTRLMQDVDAIQNRFVRLSAPWGATSALVAGLVMCAFAGVTAAVAVAIVSALYVAVAYGLSRRLTDQSGREVRTTAGQFKEELSSLMAAAPELRAYGLLDKAQARVLAHASRYEAATERLAIGSGTLVLCQTISMALAVLAIFLTTASQSAPLMALALLGSIAVLDAAGTLVGTMAQNGSVAAAVERLDPLLSEAPNGTQAPLQSRIEIRGLYALRTRDRLGIAGISGTGKTTFIEQMMRLRDDPADVIYLDGQSVGDINPQRTRALFAYAPQQAVFITGTVAENLRLAAPKATDEELWAALEDACLAERIRQSPLGLKMPLGENARFLSGGERRRLGLARAYLRVAPFLVLDEPTEGLDPTTEDQIVARLDARLKLTGQGLILISHRPAPLALCQDMAVTTGRNPDGSIRIAQAKDTAPRNNALSVHAKPRVPCSEA